MGDVLVKRATLSADDAGHARVASLLVSLHGLPDRVIDRDTALAWMRDGHSLIPFVGGRRAPALQLVTLDDGAVIRTDNAPESADALPALPTV